MRDLFHDFLFSKGLLVGTGEEAQAPVVLASLAKLFNIRVTSHPGWASLSMVQVAGRNLGVDVPKPFYRSFPQSVRGLSLDQVVLDRLLHYARTYGQGDFSQAGHALFEEEVVRGCFSEQSPLRDFAIISEEEAQERLEEAVGSLLASTRPLNDVQYGVVRAFIEDYGYEASACASKDTACRLLLDLRDVWYARFLKLSDVIRLVERLQFQSYEGADIRKLNLRNRDRKLLVAVLDRIFERGEVDLRTCLEKRKQWKGLLHHLHYRPAGAQAERFAHAVRNNDARSAYADFERLLAQGQVLEALELLREEKGAGAVLRQLDYLLSKCDSAASVDRVLDALHTRNKILLVQLLLHYSRQNPKAPRTFTFQKFGMLRVHHETLAERARRTTVLDERVVAQLRQRLRGELAQACKGTLGKVYVAKGMERIGLPLQEGTSMGGVGSMPRGSRLPIPEGKKIRAFTYWERVNDIDLSAFVLDEDGGKVEFSWRTVWSCDSILYSGDQTSGYEGGSEYFDVDPVRFREEFPEGSRYVVLCDTVYTGTPFSACLCKAGFMTRDRVDSGEVFEPKTVQTSFTITCPSTFAYLFGIDMKTSEFVWLNMARFGQETVAGSTNMSFLLDELGVVDVISLADFARMLATQVVDDASEADVVFSDADEPLRAGAELIHSTSVERLIELLN